MRFTGFLLPVAYLLIGVSFSAICAGAPVNDECATAQQIVVPTDGSFASYDFDTTGATTSPEVINCQQTVCDVWFTTQPLSDVLVRVSTCQPYGGDTTVATVVAAYSGSCADEVQLACGSYGCGGYQSSIKFAVDSGPVIIRIGGNNRTAALEGSGTFTVNVTPCPTCPSLGACGVVTDPVCNRTLVCDCTTTSGTTGSPAPFAMWGAHYPAPALIGTVAVHNPFDNKVYVDGGYTLIDGTTFLTTTRAFDAATNTWSSEMIAYGDIPEPRFVHRGAFLPNVGAAGTMLIHGGAQLIDGSTYFAYNGTYMFDFDTRVWTKVAELVPARSGFASVLTNTSQFVVFGGWNGSTVLGDLHAFDVGSLRWRTPVTTGNAPQPRWYPSGVLTPDNRMIINGGLVWTGMVDSTNFYTTVRTTRVLDLNAWHWLPEIDSPTVPALMGHSVVYSSICNCLVVFGGTSFRTGRTPPYIYSNAVYRVDLVSYQWTPVNAGTPPVARWLSASVLPDGWTSMWIHSGLNGTHFQPDVLWLNLLQPGTTTSQPGSQSTTGGQTGAITMQVTIDAYFPTYNKSSFVPAVAALINVPTSSIVVKSFEPGSVVVTFTIMPGPGVDPQDRADALTQELQSNPNALPGGTVTNVQQLTARSSGNLGSTSATPLAIGLGVGLGVGVPVVVAAVVTAVVLAARRRRLRRQRSPWPLREPADEEMNLPEIDPNTLILHPPVDISLIPRQYIISMEEISIETQLATGGFGIVYRARYHGTPCVLKESLVQSETQQAAFIKEAVAMTKLHVHPNVVQLLGVCVEPHSPLGIVLEWVDAGSLETLLLDHSNDVSGQLALDLCRDIAAGMRHLHAEGMLHCDLSARNVLLANRKNSYIAKIADFGLSHFANTQTGALNTSKSDVYSSESALKLPIRWTAPEVLEKPTQASRASDVWSFGVVVWEILQREIPYGDLKDNAQVIVAVCKGTRLPPPTTVEHVPLLDEIMTQCFSTAPGERPSFEDIHTKLEALYYADFDPLGASSNDPNRYNVPFSTSAYSTGTSAYNVDGNLSDAATTSQSLYAVSNSPPFGSTPKFSPSLDLEAHDDHQDEVSACAARHGARPMSSEISVV